MDNYNIQERLKECLFEIDELKHEIDKLREIEDEYNKLKWSVHTETNDNLHNLPVPRLEMEWYKDGDDWYNRIIKYRLVYKHFIGYYVNIPLGETTVSGGNGDIPKLDPNTSLPIRDGAHIRSDMAHMNLPAFMIIDGKYKQINYYLLGYNED